jgi:hypothetical protein
LTLRALPLLDAACIATATTTGNAFDESFLFDVLLITKLAQPSFNLNPMFVVLFQLKTFLPLIRREYLADARTYVFWRTEFYLANISITYWCNI